MFGGSNDLRILQNKDRCVRIDDSSATVQESCRSDFGASRKAPKTEGYAHEKAKRRRMAEPRAPQLEIGRASRRQRRYTPARGLGHTKAELSWGRGPPAGSSDSSFRLNPSTFQHVWRVKRPQNPTK